MARNQEDPNQLELDIQLSSNSKQQGSIECLGLTFESDDARREYFLEKLREKLKDPEFRKIEGFPIGEDEDILALSNPPYYTACPNPFLEDFIKQYGKPYTSEMRNYRREPFATDISEGKTDSLYLAHSYHTKVPPRAIARYLLWFTRPGDIVLDAYCGSGMTGLAADICAAPSSSFRSQLEQEWNLTESGEVPWGLRYVLLNDISPAATFIAANYTYEQSPNDVKNDIKSALYSTQSRFGWIYETLHNGWRAGEHNPERWINQKEAQGKGKIVCIIWSEILSCPHCGEEINLWKDALDPEKASIKEQISCPRCGAVSNKRELERCQETKWDAILGTNVTQNKFIPAFIVYEKQGKRFEKLPDEFDIETLHKVEDLTTSGKFPIRPMMDTGGAWGNLYRAGYHKGISHIHHFFTKRNWFLFSELWNSTKTTGGRFVLTSILNRMSRMSSLHMKNFFRGGGGFVAGNTKGNLYFPSLFIEQSPFEYLPERLKGASVAFQERNYHSLSYISTGSASTLALPDNAIDYVFIDPPFGENLIYSELNFLWEAWLGIKTDIKAEAIVDNFRKKDLISYQESMKVGFQELYRVLKPNRWITIEFHNSQNSVWMVIQEALQVAGFVVADVRVLDKKQGSHKQNVAVGSVKKDLVISAYKPHESLEERFKLEVGTEEGCWEFVRAHLQQLPVFVSRNDQAEAIAERQNYLLFDRMVAFYVQRGITVPLSAAEFYAGLAQRFSERDGMYFLPEQVAEYDRKRMTVREVLQLEVFVTDESSAVQWLTQQLTKKPQTFQELQPQFMQETAAGWSKFEKRLELSELLEQNFLRYDGKGVIPNQIISWLKQSAIHREKIRQIESESQTDTAELEIKEVELLSAAKDKWYVPDPSKASDLEKLRDRSLLREFEEYHQSKQKTLKVFRLEAVRAGFKKAWQERDYSTIIEVARKVPNTVLQEDPKLLMWYDQALTRVGDEE